MDTLPIGKACANTEVFAVDERDQLIEVGGVGELYVRGPSVTSGYWGDAERNERALVSNRFQPNFTEKVYRTGDVVTLEADGNYVFLGRQDDMIKSRGYRIDLGEIEAALHDHPDIAEAAVVAIPDEVTGNRIKAFVVPRGPGILTAAAVVRYCVERIPRYMVPEAVEFSDALPRTSTGKTDRSRLSQNRGAPRPAAPDDDAVSGPTSNPRGPR
jgi:acyl-coenzyme A synthetase/AMP-(fatty) acid ligase